MTSAFVRRSLMLAGALAFVLACACDLNPQPLPPGVTGGSTNSPGAGTDASDHGSGDAGGTFAGDDSGAGGGVLDSTVDTGMPGPPEGGADVDGADAGESDAPSDSATDSADSPTDAVDEGG